MFGCVIAGRPLITEFIPIDQTRCFTEIPYPSGVSEFTFFLMPNIILPPEHGVVLYYSLPPFSNWTLIGSVQLDKPSGIFRTGWSSIEEANRSSSIRLAVSLEPLSTIKNLDISGSGVYDRFAYAQKIAQDLFQYMVSFSSSTTMSPNGEMMLVPTKILDMWMERFQRKYKMDPNFMMKSAA